MDTTTDPDGARATTVRALAVQGDQHLREGRPEEAIALFLAAFEMYDGLGPAGRAALCPPAGERGGITAARLHAGLGVAAFQAGEYAEAKARFLQALAEDEAAGDEWAVARDLGNLGVVSRQTGDLDGALAAYERAHRIETRSGVAPADLAVTINNIGMVLRGRGETAAGLARFREALTLLPPGDESLAPRRASVLSNIAGCDLDSGHLADAVDHYRQALDTIERLAGESADAARYHNNLGFAYHVLGESQRALAEYEHALRIDSRISPRSGDVARDLINIAGVHRDAGTLDSALRYYRRARRLLAKVAPRSLEMAACLTNLGGVLHLRGDTAGALRWYRRALELERAIAPGSAGVALDLGNIGSILFAQGELDEAYDHLLQALTLERKSGEDSLNMALASHSLAQVLHAQGRRDAAVEELTRAMEVAESLRSRAGLDRARELVLAQHEVVFTDLVDWLYDRAAPGDHERAFLVAERFRARVLLDLFAERLLELHPSDDHQSEVLRRDQEAADRLAATFAHRSRAELERDEEARQRLAAIEHTQAEELDRLRAEARTLIPAYARLRAPTPDALETVQAQLRPNELMLTYLLTATRAFVWAVRRDAVTLRELPEHPERIATLVQAGVGDYRQGGRGGPDAQAAQRSLARRLLEPVPHESWKDVGRLFVVPGGQLAYLPFELLPLSSGRLVVDEYVVSYCPSATVFTQLRRQTRRDPSSWGESQFVGFADPATAYADRSLSSRLPAAQTEVHRVAASFGGTGSSWTGSDVTKSRIAATVPGHRYVHFATHAFLNDHEPLYSGLLVAPDAPPDARGASAEGEAETLLQVYEMFRLRLSAEVVVCSACQSGLGPIRAGEGLVGMSRALLVAGAETVVLTSWPVVDTPTSRVVRRFYDFLRTGHGPADALTRAKRSVRHTHPAVYATPATWAGLVIVGAK
ncbi:CHAT domain-containing protein [Streptomyces rishiriensis]|uniref:CHAT domain-containing protein n=1 Tax=Streptomyces rishiriensis TaxID=68264 RepID=UPI00379AAB81